MKAVIVKASELGYVCWSPYRFVNSCHMCVRYRFCDYSERVANEEFDRLFSSVYRTLRMYAKARRKLRLFIEGGNNA